MTPWTEDGLLDALRARGAASLESVRFRENRRTIWSVTGAGRRLNLHAAYRGAPTGVVVQFAVLLRELLGGRRGPEYRHAARAVRRWPGLREGLERARRRRPRRATPRRRSSPTPGPCCGTPAQLRWLRAAYLHLRTTRFDGALPEDVHLRLSRRMTSRLGHMRGLPGDAGPGLPDRRTIVEIALSLDLMLPGNEAELVRTLLHEMVHAAEWLENGLAGHGPGWKSRARRVGCSDRARCGGPIVRRARVGDPVEHTPAAEPGRLAARVLPSPYSTPASP